MMLAEEQQVMKTFWRTYMIFDKTLECIRNNDYHDDVKTVRVMTAMELDVVKSKWWIIRSVLSLIW